MVYFRKRLTPEVLGEINEMIVRDAKERQVKEAESKDDDDDSDGQPGTGGNSGTMIVDATCAPSNIRYPQDVSQLNEARENAETLLDVLHDPADGKKPRTYRKRARKDYLKYTRCRKHTAKMTRKAIGKQLTYLRRDLNAIDGKLSLGKNLPPRQTERLGTIRTVYEQQKYMYDNRTHSVPDRIVSVSQPFVRPIVRGKAGKPVEFGAKLDISVVNGWTRLEYCSFDAYNEAGNLREMAERFRAREGHYPSRILADKIYRNRENLSYCNAHGIRLSGPALGRPKKGETRDKAQDYRDECERVEVERRFSLAKRMLRDFEAELSDLTEIIFQDQQELERISRETINAEKFLALVRKYTDFSELTPAVINEFVEKILVHQAQGKGASRTQEIEIFFNFIGKVDIPHKEVELTEEEKAALAEQERRRAKKQNTIDAIWKKRRQWKEQLEQAQAKQLPPAAEQKGEHIA